MSHTLRNALGFTAAATAAYYLVHYLRRTPPLGQVEIIGHRGAPRYAPENTLPSFENAIALGADRLECDVHLTYDGEPVVIHDETLERTTNGAGRVGDFTLAELRKLNAGAGAVIPTLGDYIAIGQQHNVGLLIELKSPHLYPGVEERVLADLEAANYLHRTILQSFDFDSLRRLRQLRPTAKLGALYGLSLDTTWPPADADFVCPPAELVALNPGLVRTAHQQGRGVFCWFNTPASDTVLLHRFLLAFGVDGLITDDPQVACQALRRPALAAATAYVPLQTA